MLRGEVVVSKERMMRWGLMNDMRRKMGRKLERTVCIYD